jgi:hypothetical protein
LNFPPKGERARRKPVQESTSRKNCSLDGLVNPEPPTLESSFCKRRHSFFLRLLVEFANTALVGNPLEWGHHA